ncbi:MAG: tyrosine-type recombinase/integrase, partial [Nitrospirae bacterium]|nr:tyrosine-type recombinase/integrase [Nitrospirota bacterium]
LHLASLANCATTPVDLKEGKIELPAWMTKTKRPRTVFLPEEALFSLREWYQQSLEFMKQTHRTIQFVFHRGGTPLKDFGGAWKAACKRAGYPNRLFHDFRRTSIRNNIRQGIDPKVCMAISGHRTRSVFDRYNIVSEDDLRNAALRLSQGRNGEEMGKMIGLEARKVDR